MNCSGNWVSVLGSGHVLSSCLKLRNSIQVVIFVKSVPRARELNRLLNECNFPSVCIHRGMQQEER